ncbi:uncharacterized protein LOC135154835 [Lytechinus pictus]|uniref:uncharacterized protein LOC135154835 n=1 Tax=Lytechinus pictus TaxID=7653 RepID=UPI0030BA0129
MEGRLLVWPRMAIIMILCCIHGIMGDIKDGVVYTDLLKTVPRGSTAVLDCRFYRAPLAVYWKKGHDPEQATSLVTWMDDKIWPGLCADDNSCEIANNYSLIIKEAQIKDEGRYICRVSNYRGILIHNFTDLSVVEPPTEPYPAIKECNDSSSIVQDFGCSITTLTNVNPRVNLNCYASGFYPKLSLFFLHGTEKIASSETKEWINDDETRSKSVSISAVPSKMPYVCVASDIPGQHKERAVTAFVRLPEEQTSAPEESTTMTTMPPKGTNLLMVIVIPLASLGVVTVIGASIFMIWLRRHRRKVSKGSGNDDIEEGYPLMETKEIKGKLSFYELWMMVSKVTMSDMGKLNDTFEQLGIGKLIHGFTLPHAYKHLCQWKAGKAHDDEYDLAQELRTALEKAKYPDAWKEIYDVRTKSTVMVSERMLEHILWHIGEQVKINTFLSEITHYRHPTDTEDTERISELIPKKLEELKKWASTRFDENPVSLLSLALEKAECTPVDRTFFCVPDQPISNQELQYFTSKLTGRHCHILASALELTTGKIATISDENNEHVFQTQSMIGDWLSHEENEQERSEEDITEEKRSLEISHAISRRYEVDHAAISIGRSDLKGYLVGYSSYLILEREKDIKQAHNTKHAEEVFPANNVSDGEIQSITRFLEPDERTTLFGDLEGEDYCFTAIKTWMKKEQAADQKANCREKLLAKLKPIGKEGLVPLENKEDLYLVELADIAFRLLMTDVYPLAMALGISEDKLRSYRRLYLTPSNMSRGTIGVMKNICRNDETTRSMRRQLCDILKHGFPEISLLLNYGYELSQADLYDVSFGEGSKEANRIKIRENLGIISTVTNTMDMLKYWRSLVKCPTYNWRKALAEAVYPVLEKEVALGILTGDIRRSGKQGGNVSKYLQDTFIHLQALNFANIVDVENISSDKPTVEDVLNVLNESLKSQPPNEEQRLLLRKRLDDEGFRNFSAKLTQFDEHAYSENKGIPKEIEIAIKIDVATKLSGILEVAVKLSEGTSYLKQVLEEWVGTLGRKPLQSQNRIHLSDRLLKEGFVDFSLEVMLGTVMKGLEARKPFNVTQTITKPSQSSSHNASQNPSQMKTFVYYKQ